MDTTLRIGSVRDTARCRPMLLVAVLLVAPLDSAMAQGFRLPRPGGGGAGAQYRQPQMQQFQQPQNSRQFLPRMQQQQQFQNSQLLPQTQTQRQVQSNLLPRNQRGGVFTQEQANRNSRGLPQQAFKRNQLPLQPSQPNTIGNPTDAVTHRGNGFKIPGMNPRGVPANSRNPLVDRGRLSQNPAVVQQGSDGMGPARQPGRGGAIGRFIPRNVRPHSTQNPGTVPGNVVLGPGGRSDGTWDARSRVTQVLGTPNVGQNAPPVGGGVGANGVPGHPRGHGRPHHPTRQVSGLNLFGLGLGGYGYGPGFGVPASRTSGYYPGYGAEREYLLTMFEYNCVNGTLGPQDFEVLDVIRAEEQAGAMTSAASLGSLCGGVSTTIVGGCGLPTPMLCYVAQPVPAPDPTQSVVLASHTPAATDATQPTPTGGAPEVVTEGAQASGTDPISIPPDPGPAPTTTADASTAASGDTAAQAIADRGADVTGSDPDAADKLAEPENLIILTNSEDSGGPVSYDLSGFTYTIEPGNVQTLTTRPSWVVSFDRGEDFGQASYTLINGTYTFTVTEKGWDLVATTYEVSLDNSRNDSDFSFVRNGKVETVKAGKTLTVSHKFPHKILFDRGDGGEPGERTLERGFYSIGIEEKSGLFEIKPIEKSPATEAPSAATGAKP